MTESSKGPRPKGLGKRARITTFFLRKFFQFLGWIKFVDVTVTNRQIVPRKGAAIIAANHTSMLDIVFVWTALRRPGIAIGAAEQMNRPILRNIAGLLGQIPVVRKDPESGAKAREAVKNALAWLAAFIIFPQGKIVRPGEYAPFYPGVADFALESETLVYPVYIDGADKVMPHKLDRVGRKLIYRDQKVTVTFGDPIDPTDFEGAAELLIAIEKAVFELAN